MTDKEKCRSEIVEHFKPFENVYDVGSYIDTWFDYLYEEYGNDSLTIIDSIWWQGTMNEKAKKLGVMYSPNVIFGVGKQDGKWVGSFDIGDYYYETDPYPKKECAISELCGCLETLKLKAEQVIDELNELLK